MHKTQSNDAIRIASGPMRYLPGKNVYSQLGGTIMWPRDWLNMHRDQGVLCYVRDNARKAKHAGHGSLRVTSLF